MPKTFTLPLGDKTFRFKKKLSARHLARLHHTELEKHGDSRAQAEAFILLAAAERTRLAAALADATDEDIQALVEALAPRYLAQLRKLAR